MGIVRRGQVHHHLEDRRNHFLARHEPVCREGGVRGQAKGARGCGQPHPAKSGWWWHACGMPGGMPGGMPDMGGMGGGAAPESAPADDGPKIEETIKTGPRAERKPTGPRLFWML